MGISVLPSSHPRFLGMLGMHGTYAANMAVQNCDLLFAVGTRFDDRATGEISKFAPHAAVVHVDIDPASISRNVAVEVPIVGDARLVLEELLPQLESPSIDEWVATTDEWKRSHPPTEIPDDGRLSPTTVIHALSEAFPEAIVTTEVGQNQMWTALYYDFHEPRTFLTSGGLGTMGYGFPAAIGAQLGNPGRRVIDIAGDGSIQMNIQELATAVTEGLPVIVAILNNGYLGMVRQWQELFFQKRYSATCLERDARCPPDCASPGETVPALLSRFREAGRGLRRGGDQGDDQGRDRSCPCPRARGDRQARLPGLHRPARGQRVAHGPRGGRKPRDDECMSRRGEAA